MQQTQNGGAMPRHRQITCAQSPGPSLLNIRTSMLRGKRRAGPKAGTNKCNTPSANWACESDPSKH